MVITTPDDDSRYRTVGVESVDFERYDDLSIDDGDTVIFDRRNVDAWLQSSSGIGLGVMR